MLWEARVQDASGGACCRLTWPTLRVLVSSRPDASDKGQAAVVGSFLADDVAKGRPPSALSKAQHCLVMSATHGGLAPEMAAQVVGQDCTGAGAVRRAHTGVVELPDQGILKGPSPPRAICVAAALPRRPG